MRCQTHNLAGSLRISSPAVASAIANAPVPASPLEHLLFHWRLASRPLRHFFPFRKEGDWCLYSVWAGTAALGFESVAPEVAPEVLTHPKGVVDELSNGLSALVANPVRRR